MYRHKSLKQLSCCLLLLCLFFGSSAGLFSANADTTVGNNSIVTDSQTQYDQVQGQVRVITSKWNMISADVDVEYIYNFTQAKLSSFAYTATHSQTTGSENGVGKTFVYGNGGTLTSNGAIRSQYYIYQRQLMVYVNVRNYRNSDIKLQNGNVTVNIMGTAQSFSGVDVINSSDLNFKYLSGGDNTYSVIFGVDPSLIGTNANYYMVSAGSCQATVLIEQYMYSTTPISDDFLYAPASVNISYFGNVVNDNSQHNNLISRDAAAQVNATNEQTQQQEQQYNEFSAGSDSSDSNNINSAISGGTDAVKQKMGLFSFFDGIVNSMSDILTSDHERNLVLPALDVPLPDQTVHIWDRKEFDFDELENNFGALLTVVRFATVAICYSVMISGAYSIFHKFIGVKDSDA